jgi:hypothetical protein
MYKIDNITKLYVIILFINREQISIFLNFQISNIFFLNIFFLILTMAIPQPPVINYNPPGVLWTDEETEYLSKNE